MTEEEVEYYQPSILKDIKRLLEQLKTRTPEQLVQIKEKRDMLVWCIKDADEMYPGWRHLDYYRKFSLDEQVYISNLLRRFRFKRYKGS